MVQGPDEEMNMKTRAMGVVLIGQGNTIQRWYYMNVGSSRLGSQSFRASGLGES